MKIIDFARQHNGIKHTLAWLNQAAEYNELQYCLGRFHGYINCLSDTEEIGASEYIELAREFEKLMDRARERIYKNKLKGGAA